MDGNQLKLITTKNLKTQLLIKMQIMIMRTSIYCSACFIHLHKYTIDFIAASSEDITEDKYIRPKKKWSMRFISEGYNFSYYLVFWLAT